MHDPLLVLICGLESRYVTVAVLPTLPVWARLSPELRATLAETTETGEQERKAIRRLWKLRARRLGGVRNDLSGVMTRATSHLTLGLLHLAYRRSRLGVLSLLWRAWFVADSYVCGVDCRPFSWLRREIKELPKAERRSDLIEDQVAELFRPYVGLASQCVQQWGLA